MRAIFGLVLVVGMGLAGFAVYMVKGYVSDQQLALQQERQRARAIVPTTEVYAVNRAIAYGELLSPEDVVMIRYTEEFLPEGTFTTQEALFPEGEDVLRAVTRPMEPNEPVMEVKVTKPGEIAGIAQVLRPGMRAFTIKVDVATGVSGFLRPGDKVDIYWSGNVEGRRDRANDSTHLIGQGIELIAVDQSADVNRSTNDIPRTVTVQVSPQDVASLAQAQASGNLSLALVGQNEGGASVADGETAIVLPQRAVEEVVVADAPPPEEESCFINTRRGTEIVQVPIQCTN